MASLTIKEISANINNARHLKEFPTDTQPQQRFLALQAAACEYSRLSWYFLLGIPVREESGETEGCIGRLYKLYNFDVFTCLPYRFKFGQSTIVTTRN